MSTPKAIVGLGDSFVGENLAFSAALSAAWINKGLPLCARALETTPFSLTNTWTSTVPPARAIKAASGYSGWGKSIAALRKTPSSTLLRKMQDGACTHFFVTAASLATALRLGLEPGPPTLVGGGFFHLVGDFLRTVD